jgi:transposase
MRRTHLRGHDNILKRLLVHAGAFNLGLFMRSLIGVGTPRSLQGLGAACVTLLVTLWAHVADRADDRGLHDGGDTSAHRFELLPAAC